MATRNPNIVCIEDFMCDWCGKPFDPEVEHYYLGHDECAEGWKAEQDAKRTSDFIASMPPGTTFGPQGG